jgi:dCMP deaminase
MTDSRSLEQRKWDDYFMAFARLASANSKCGSRKIGAALVKDKRVVATGYNGPPQGMDRCSDRYRADQPDGWISRGMASIYTLGSAVKREDMEPAIGRTRNHWSEGNFCPRREFGFKSGKGLEICVAGHAERNALIQAARLGISTAGSTLYAYCGIPCKDCAIEIVNAGIKKVVCLKKDYEYDALGRFVLMTGGVEIEEIPDLTDIVFDKA